MNVDIKGIGISPAGEYLAICSPQGCLNVWETLTGSFYQQYTPSSHLASSCKCLCWEPGWSQENNSLKKLKKRKSNQGSGLNLIALGCSAGGILIYSVTKGSLQCTLPAFHRKAVNDISWSSKNKLYSCSNDGYVAEWNASEATLNRKWIGDENGVFSVLSISECYLLTASRSIKLWDLTSLKVLKSFPGHSSEVKRLLLTPQSNNDGLNSYFLSVSEDEKFINVWNTNPNETVDAVVKLNCKDDVCYVEMKPSSIRPGTVLLSAVTKLGVLNVFEHVFNGVRNKPIVPKYTVQISSDPKTNGEVTSSIPILFAHISFSDILIMYGSYEAPKFEKLELSKLEPKLYLHRSLGSKSSHLHEPNLKVKSPKVNNTVNYLVPSTMINNLSKSEAKKRKGSYNVNQLPMEERLNALALEKNEDGSTRLPRSDNLTNLLIQGLQSHDIRILQNVIHCNDESTILNTIKRLPVQFIIPLIDNLKFSFQGRGHVNQSHIKWIRSLLQVHASYLMSCTNACTSLGPLYQLIDARSDVFKRLTQLKGRLDLMMSQLSCKHEETAKVNNTPLLTFQDEASDEDSEVFGGLMMPNESDDSWEELSDADEGTDMDVQENDSSEESQGDNYEDT